MDFVSIYAPDTKRYLKKVYQAKDTILEHPAKICLNKKDLIINVEPFTRLSCDNGKAI